MLNIDNRKFLFHSVLDKSSSFFFSCKTTTQDNSKDEIIFHSYPKGSLAKGCFQDPARCPQGISFAVWLNYLDGMFIATVKSNQSIELSITSPNPGSLLLRLTALTKQWEIRRTCFPVGWFHVLITWSSKGAVKGKD